MNHSHFSFTCELAHLLIIDIVIDVIIRSAIVSLSDSVHVGKPVCLNCLEICRGLKLSRGATVTISTAITDAAFA
jgi:hypothetical protein